MARTRSERHHSHTRRIPRRVQRAIGWMGLSAGMLVLDFRLGPRIQFPITYVLPVGLAAWWSGRGWGIALALILPAVRLSYYSLWGESVTIGYSIVNAVIRVIILAGLAVLLARIAEQNRALTREVKVLRGILPICSFCKRIRDGREHWQPLESYVSARSEAQFSHTFCPDCERHHYTEYLEDH